MLKITCCYILLLSLFCLPLSAQTMLNSIGEQEWHIIKSMDGFLPGHPDKSFALFEMSKSDFGVIAFTDKGQVKWTIRIKDKPIVITVVENNLILLTGSQATYSGYGGLDMMIIDPANGKTLQQKNIFKPQPNIEVSAQVFISAKMPALKMALYFYRQKKDAKVGPFDAGGGKIISDADDDNKIQILSFNKNLDLINTLALSMPAEKNFGAGLRMDIDGNMFHGCYFEDKQEVTVYRFPDGKSVSDKQISIPVTAKKFRSIRQMNLVASEEKPSVAWFSCIYENGDKDDVSLLARFDFLHSTTASATDILDKKYRKELEAQSFKKFEKIREPDLDLLDKRLTLVKMIESGDKLVVFKDIVDPQYYGQGAMYQNGNALVSVYDAGMKKLYDRVVPKIYKSYKPFGLGADMRVKDGVAYILANDSQAGYMKATVLFFKMDINSGNVLAAEHLAKDEIGVAEPIDIKAIVWFKENMILSYLKLKSWFSNGFTTIPVLYKY